MHRLWVRLVLGLTLVYTGVLGVLLATASAAPSGYHAELAQFLGSAECRGGAAPCWQGIHVGASTRDEALAVLRNLRWIDQATLTESTYSVSWRWATASQAFLSPDTYSRIEFSRDEDRVFSVLLYGLQIAAGDLWVSGGSLSQMRLYPQIYGNGMTPPPPGYGIIAYAPTLSANVFALLDCPVYPDQLWNTVITRLMYSSIGYAWDEPFLPGELYGQIYECQPRYDPT